MTDSPATNERKANYWAVGSLIAGVFAIIGVGAGEPLAAIICGAIAIGAAPYALNKKHDGRGRVQAIIGIVLGAVPLLILAYAYLRQ